MVLPIAAPLSCNSCALRRLATFKAPACLLLKRIEMIESRESLRIDLWLYRSRFFKTRSQATAAVLGGHVRLNGERTTPGARVRPEDRIDLVRNRLPYALNVIAIPTRRGPAAEASECFEEDEAIASKRAEQIQAIKQDRMLAPRTAGRPNKHTRHKLIKRRRS